MDEAGFSLVAILFFLFETGYVFKILEETVHGSLKPPQFNRFSSLILHGVKESIVTILYFSIPLILFFIGLDLFSSYLELGLGALNDFLGLDVGQLNSMVFLGAIFIMFSAVSIIFQGVLLNMAHNNGTIHSAFNFLQILSRLKKIGFKRLFFIYAITAVLLIVLKNILFDTLHQLPIVGDIILTLIITPYLLILTTRMLGLIDVSNER
ncbi:MAG: DUF4013 domain-containing protein [Methanobacteriaceae archaeon]|nr:DUF4013 domain-containing protein [Methanobacteriaceae archaeon]